MELLTIGAFARVSRLSPKALRRYDELGLLRPAHTDPFTGYRHYDQAQTERARLVAWLRRIGMPLARVREVCDLAEADASAAARQVRAYWARVEAETAARRDLADFLVDQLSVKDTDPMSQLTTPLTIRYAARSDRGLVRDSNQDVAYAGSRLLAVADGFGTDGGRAGSGAVDALKALETEVADGLQGSAPPRAGDLLNALEDAVQRADAAVHGLDGSGTTLTAMLWTGSRLALVHIGDTRAYLLRDGMFFQITHDHTVVQSMVDEGSLDAEEAASHPQRAMLLRALDGRPGLARPDLRLHEAKPGDRYLLCSDGLFVAVPHAGIRRTVESAGDPEDTVTGLIALAHEAGAPDNVACVVADVVGEAVPA